MRPSTRRKRDRLTRIAARVVVALIIVLFIALWLAMIAGAIAGGYFAYVAFEEGRLADALLCSVLCVFCALAVLGNVFGRTRS